MAFSIFTLKKISRNDQCPCGSLKKVKKCDCEAYAYLRK